MNTKNDLSTGELHPGLINYERRVKLSDGGAISFFPITSAGLMMEWLIEHKVFLADVLHRMR